MATIPVSIEVGEEADQEEATTLGEQITIMLTITSIIRELRGLDTLPLYTPKERISTKRRVSLHLRITTLHMDEMPTSSVETECQRHSIQKCGKCFLSEFL